MTFNYTLNWSSDALKQPFTLPAGVIDTSTTSLTLTGKASIWGEYVNENMLHLLENFSSNIPPANPTFGQVWYDTGANQLKFLTTASQWEILWPHPETSGPIPTAPTAPIPTPVTFAATELTSLGSPGSLSTSIGSTLQLISTNATLSAVSLISGSLPGGMTLSASGVNAQISGAATLAGSYSGIIRVQHATSATPSLLDRNFYINVADPSSPTPTSPTPTSPTPTSPTPVAPSLTSFASISVITSQPVSAGTASIFSLSFIGTPDSLMPVNVNFTPDAGLSGLSGIYSLSVMTNSFGVGTVDVSYNAVSAGTYNLNAFALLQSRSASTTYVGSAPAPTPVFVGPPAPAPAFANATFSQSFVSLFNSPDVPTTTYLILSFSNLPHSTTTTISVSMSHGGVWFTNEYDPDIYNCVSDSSGNGTISIQYTPDGVTESPMGPGTYPFYITAYGTTRIASIDVIA